MCLPLSNLEIKLGDWLDADALAAAAAFQPVAFAGFDTTWLQRHELRIKGKARLRLRLDGDNHVAARNIDLAVENQRDGIACDGGIAHQIECHDLLDICHHAGGKNDDAVARLYRAARDGALITTKAFTGARYALYRQTEASGLG